MLMKKNTGKIDYHLNPEIMMGVSRNIMIHADVYLSNRNRSLTSSEEGFGYDGASLYLKYRMYSQDEVHNHFRLAAFSKVSSSIEYFHQPAIDLNGHNSGYEIGIVATKLVNKVAISAGSSFLHAKNNGSNKFIYSNSSRDAIGYTLSIGKLMLPKEYTDYNQTNINLMVEMLGQYNLGFHKSYIDLAPSIQFIFLSKMRLDLGYRFPVVNNLTRTADRGFLLRLEYNFFNVYK
jgi:hypothetical protein